MTASTERSAGDATLLDSEITRLISWHSAEAATLAFRHDYGRDWKKHIDRVRVLTEYLQLCLDKREEGDQ